jgi:hypothetical protein
MRSMEAYPRTAMERAMKVQDVMLQAIGEEDHVVAGGEDSGHQRPAHAAVAGALRGRGLQRAVRPAAGQALASAGAATVEKVFALYREKYFDLNVQHFHEKLQAEHGIELSYSWVKQALQERGWWREDASAGRIASGESVGRCRGCCCTSTAAGISGFRTNAGTT